MAERNEKVGMFVFPVDDSTPNKARYFSSMDRQCKWPSLSRKIVEVQKFCNHGNVTSYFFLYCTYVVYARKRRGGKIPSAQVL